MENHNEHQLNGIVTLRDWFANNAPTRPSWFSEEVAGYTPPPEPWYPKTIDDLPDNIHMLARNSKVGSALFMREWINRESIPHKIWIAKVAHSMDIKWRYYYADSMMNERSVDDSAKENPRTDQ